MIPQVQADTSDEDVEIEERDVEVDGPATIMEVRTSEKCANPDLCQLDTNLGSL